MAKYKIVKGSFGISSVIYKANTENDIIESDKDLSKRDGIEKFTAIEKDVVNIAPEVKKDVVEPVGEKRKKETSYTLSKNDVEVLKELKNDVKDLKEAKVKKKRAKRKSNKAK